MSAESPVQRCNANVKGVTHSILNIIASDDITELEVTRKKLNEMSELVEDVGSGVNSMSRIHLVGRLVRIITKDQGVDDRISDDEFADEYEMQKLLGNQLSLPVLEKLLPRFTGDNIANAELWMDHFEELADMCEWSDMQKIIYCRSLLQGSAQLFVEMVRCLSWDHLKTALLAEFADVSKQAVVRNILMNRAKQSNETPRQYFYKMRHIAAQADISANDLIKYIANGIGNEEKYKAALRRARSIPELKRKLLSYQTKLESPSPKRQALSIEADPNCDGNPVHTDGGTDTSDESRCYKCNKLGHISENCGKK